MNQSQNSKNILFVAYHLSTGGMPQFLLKKIEALLSDDNVNVFLIEIQDITGGKFVVQREQIIELLRDRFFSINNDHNLFIRLIDTIKPNNIHFEEFVEFFLPDNICNQIFIDNRTYTISETTHDSGFDPSHKKFFPDSWQFVSKYTEKRYRHYNIPIQVIEYPIQKKFVVDRKQELEKLGLDPNKFHVLNVGLFSNRKNQREIIEYAKTFKEDGYDDVVFHFVGNLADNFRDYWKPIIDNLPNNCVIWGERKDVDSFYSCMDLFLFTSLGNPQDLETNPLVIKEALSWDMKVFLYDLSVYENKFNYEPNVTLLSNDKFKNIDLILNEFKNFKNLNFINNTRLIKSENSKNDLFFHLYIGDYETKSFEILEELFDKINSTEIIFKNLFLHWNTNKDFDYTEKIKQYLERYKIYEKIYNIQIIFNTEKYENGTINALDIYSKSLEEKRYILYLHSKGSANVYPFNDCWRNQFYESLFEHSHLDRLIKEGMDVSSIFMIFPGHDMVNHYAGNMWWTQTDYIKRVIPFRQLQDIRKKERLENKDLIKVNCGIRFDAEVWICNSGSCRWYSAKEFVSIRDICREEQKKLLIEQRNCESSQNNVGIIISTHPQTMKQLNDTHLCVEKLRSHSHDNEDFPISIVTHYPITDKTLYDKVENIIYDSHNPFTRHTFYSVFYNYTDAYDVQVQIIFNDNDLYHGPAVLNNFINGAVFLKSIGCKYGLFVNYDYHIPQAKIRRLIEYLEGEDKKGLFIIEDFPEGKSLHTAIFLINLDLFLSRFRRVVNDKSYRHYVLMSGAESNGLENVFYHILKNDLDDLVLSTPWHHEDSKFNIFFPNAELNKHQMVEYYTVLPVKNKNEFAAYYRNSSHDVLKISIKLFENETLIKNIFENLNGPRDVFVRHTFKENSNYRIEFTKYNEIDEIIHERKITFNMYEDIIDNGFVDFKD